MIRYNTSLKTSFSNRKVFLGTQQPVFWKMALMGKSSFI